MTFIPCETALDRSHVPAVPIRSRARSKISARPRADRSRSRRRGGADEHVHALRTARVARSLLGLFAAASMGERALPALGRPTRGVLHIVGSMFALRRNRFVGSYAFFSAASRG